ncbi:MAG: hypothetical protein PVI97_19565 [Candidatus Thiodiazotropha sp.]
MVAEGLPELDLLLPIQTLPIDHIISFITFISLLNPDKHCSGKANKRYQRNMTVTAFG